MHMDEPCLDLFASAEKGGGGDWGEGVDTAFLARICRVLVRMRPVEPGFMQKQQKPSHQAILGSSHESLRTRGQT